MNHIISFFFFFFPLKLVCEVGFCTLQHTCPHNRTRPPLSRGGQTLKPRPPLAIQSPVSGAPYTCENWSSEVRDSDTSDYCIWGGSTSFFMLAPFLPRSASKTPNPTESTSQRAHSWRENRQCGCVGMQEILGGRGRHWRLMPSFTWKIRTVLYNLKKKISFNCKISKFFPQISRT